MDYDDARDKHSLTVFLVSVPAGLIALFVGVVLGSLKSIWPLQNVSNVELDINHILFMLIVMISGLFISIVIPFATSILKHDK